MENHIGFDNGCTCIHCCDIRDEMEVLLLSGDFRYDEDEGDTFLFNEELAMENLADAAIETPW